MAQPATQGVTGTPRERVVVIHQPDFAPWLGFFHRLAACDCFVVLDDVQFLRRGWHHRDRLKAPGGPVWLTVPVVKKDRFDQQIREAEIQQSVAWRRKHLGFFRTAYGKAPHFETLFPALETVYAKSHRFLIDFNMDVLRLMLDMFGISVPIRVSSQFETSREATRRLIDLVRAVEGTVYLTGTGSRSYLDEAAVHAGGIDLRWQDFAMTPYPQLHGGDFLPGLSALDYLFNCADRQGRDVFYPRLTTT